MATVYPSQAQLTDVLRKRFALEQFRDGQLEVCADVTAGRNVLLVMPTGGGKSLCYLLPGLIRDGCALVISPLISLIEDQVMKLTTLGLRAYSLHSGQSREEQQNISRRYLAGEIDYLYFAPERLRSALFVEFLQRRPVALIAIDEAHCVSEWGHDFRVDYRYLGPRLAGFAKVPRIAVTATASPEVQADILAQLELGDQARVEIRGFWRDNLAIKVAKVASFRRWATVQRYLQHPERLPAIIYVSRKKDAEIGVHALGGQLRTAYYHGGMARELRTSVLRQFLGGDLDVVVATVAFGMGVDKPNVRSVIHLTLPDTVASYYQQIGRGGRDGKRCDAVLFYSEMDFHFRSAMLEQSFPELERLLDVQHRVTEPISWPQFWEWITRDYGVGLADRLVHWGVVQCHGSAETGWAVRAATDDTWQDPYVALRQAKERETDRAYRFCFQRRDCRMRSIAAHFGEESPGRACSHCDVCLGGHGLEPVLAPSFVPNPDLCQKILRLVMRRGFFSYRKLYCEIAGTSSLASHDFDRCLEYLAYRQQIAVSEQAFEKEGQTRHYLKIVPLKQTHVVAEV